MTYPPERFGFEIEIDIQATTSDPANDISGWKL
jgi:hypothetical protein